MDFKNEQIELLENLDKKLIIKEIKEKGKNKTFIQGFNLYDEFKDNDSLKKFMKELKNKFACACTLLVENNQSKLMLQGFHKDKIREFMKEKYPKIKIE